MQLFAIGWTLSMGNNRLIIKALSARRIIGVRRSNISNVVFLIDNDKQTKDKEIVFIFQ